MALPSAWLEVESKMEAVLADLVVEVEGPLVAMVVVVVVEDPPLEAERQVVVEEAEVLVSEARFQTSAKGETRLLRLDLQGEAVCPKSLLGLRLELALLLAGSFRSPLSLCWIPGPAFLQIPSTLGWSSRSSVSGGSTAPPLAEDLETQRDPEPSRVELEEAIPIGKECLHFRQNHGLHLGGIIYTDVDYLEGNDTSNFCYSLIIEACLGYQMSRVPEVLFQEAYQPVCSLGLCLLELQVPFRLQ